MNSKKELVICKSSVKRCARSSQVTQCDACWVAHHNMCTSKVILAPHAAASFILECCVGLVSKVVCKVTDHCMG
jgi:hypothetical protein